MEIEFDDQTPQEDAGAAIGAGLIGEDGIEEGGLLPLPTDDLQGVDPERRSDGASRPLDEDRFESLPPALGLEGFEESDPEVEHADEASVNRNVGVRRERVQVDQEAWGRQFGDEKVKTDGAVSVVEETTVIENGEIDDAAEAFDLGDLFE